MDSVAVSGTNTYYSNRIPVADLASALAWHFEWSGDPTGALTLWGTNKDRHGVQADAATDTDWVQVTTFAPTNPAGAPSKYADTGGMAHFAFVRFKYVNASGSGVMNCWVTLPLNSR